jgi:hypothetical protein
MTSLHEVNEFMSRLASGGAPAVSFPNIGDSITGAIVAADVRDQTKFGTDEVITDRLGRPRKEVVITLQTDLREDPEDDGLRRVFVKNQMLSAVIDAVQDATGAANLEEGGKLWIKFDSTKESQFKGNPQKIYVAKYQAPTKSADLGGGDDSDADAPF